MASTANSTSAPAQQPTLRPFVVYDKMPVGCVTHMVVDQSTAPLLRPADTVIADTGQREPIVGELFLIEWCDGNRAIVTCWPCNAPAGTSWHNCLWVGPYAIPRGWADLARANGCEPRRAGDGPYRPDRLAQKIVGQIVGLFEPDFAEPVRLAA